MSEAMLANVRTLHHRRVRPPQERAAGQMLVALASLTLPLTPFCLMLLSDLLSLPNQVIPQAFIDLFPIDLPQKQILRLIAAIFVVGGAFLFLLHPVTKLTFSTPPAMLGGSDETEEVFVAG